MAWIRIYGGDFLDIKSVTWTVEILRDITDGSAVPDDSSLTFPADSPLVIEWPSQGFEDVMWGSTAALRLISDSDRRFIDLYTIEPGTIRLDVYRDGSLYWSGMLDPEFYEEPYESLSGYEVELTFSDFGILKRLKYDLTGVQSIRAIVERAVAMSGIAYTSINLSTYVGVGFSSGSRSIFDASTGIGIRSDNFIDEDGELCSMSDALEGVLQPLGLRVVQRAGKIIVYDLTGLVSGYGTHWVEVSWSGDSQTLGVDKVYNSVTVTFSPYAATSILKDSLSFDSDYEITWTNLQNSPATWPHAGVRYWTYYPEYEGKSSGTTGWDYTDLDFTIFLGDGSGVELGSASSAGFFHILPIYGSAEECSGVALGFYTGGHGSLKSGYPALEGHMPKDYSATAQPNRVLTAPRVYIPAIEDSDERSKYLLRLVQEILVDCRYNPFNDASDNNESSNQSTLENNSAFVFVRAGLNIYSAETGGSPLACYTNYSVANGEGTNRLSMGSWETASQDLFGRTWLEWYNPDNLKDGAGGVGGWKGNRHCVGMPDGYRDNKYTEVNGLLRHADDGEYIPYPPVGGWLEVAIYDYVAGFKYGAKTYPSLGSSTWTSEKVYSTLRWCLFRCPEIAVVRNDLAFREADLEDVEYRGTLNEAAEDDLSIDTICGTAEDAPPTARGVYYDLSDNSQVSLLKRDGVTARPEKLLIGQLYRQYAARKTTLTGEAEMIEELLCTEQNQESLFYLMGDSQDVRNGTSEVEIREAGTDTYTADEDE